jgi:hypothetical protein
LVFCSGDSPGSYRDAGPHFWTETCPPGSRCGGPYEPQSEHFFPSGTRLQAGLGKRIDSPSIFDKTCFDHVTDEPYTGLITRFTRLWAYLVEKSLGAAQLAKVKRQFAGRE